jgi:hypothetical protein
MKPVAFIPGYVVILMLLGGCGSLLNRRVINFPISEVVGEVQDALSNVQTTIGAQGLPKLKSIKLSLQTTSTLKVNGEMDYAVLSAKGSLETDRSQSFDITLSRVYPKSHFTEYLTEGSPTPELESAIKGAIEGLQSSYAGDVPLEVSQIDVQISFKVIADKSMSAGFKLVPVAPSAGFDSTNTVTHTITVTYAK